MSSVPLPVPRRTADVRQPTRSAAVLRIHPVPVTVRTARTTDVAATARLHVRNLPIGLFPQLGERFVARWHRAFVQSPHAVALVAVATDPDGTTRVSGFLAGVVDPPAFRAEVLARHRMTLAVHGIRSLAVRPRVLARFLRTRLFPYLCRLRAPRPDAAVPPGAVSPVPAADLTAVAVDPRLRRSGAGRLLTEAFVQHCARAGVARVELSAAADAPGALRFYRATGWTPLRSHLTGDGERLQRFARWIDRTEAG